MTERKRKLACLRHLRSCQEPYVPWSVFVDSMHRTLCTQGLWHDYFVASEEEKLAEVSWALGRPSARTKRKATMDEVAMDLSNCESLLSPTEVKYLDDYKAMIANDPLSAEYGAVVSLGQNPKYHAMSNIGKRVLSTVT